MRSKVLPDLDLTNCPLMNGCVMSLMFERALIRYWEFKLQVGMWLVINGAT